MRAVQWTKFSLNEVIRLVRVLIRDLIVVVRAVPLFIIGR
jgi:hypothetical protein